MKNIAKYLFAISAAAFTFAACEKEAEIKPGEPELDNCYGVYFPVQEASGDHIYNPTQDKVLEITVARTNTEGAITVPVTASFTDPDGPTDVFTASDIVFADGQAETTFTVNFDNAEEGVKYAGHFVIEDNQYASIYSKNSIGLDFSVMCVEMLTLKDEAGTADAKVNFTINNDFLGDFNYNEDSYQTEGKIEYYEVDGVRYGKVVVNQDGGVWFSGAEINFIWYPNVDYEYGDFVYQPVEVAVGRTGYELDGAEVGEDHPCAVLFCDYYHHWKDIKSNNLGSYLDFVKDYGQSYLLSYYDGHGGFHFNLVYDIEGTNYWYGFCEDSVLGIAEGYERVDYRLQYESDYCSNGAVPVTIGTGVDIKKVLLTTIEGKLNSAQVETALAGIKEDAENVITIATDGFTYDDDSKLLIGGYDIELEKTGEYTVILVALDEANKVQATDNFVIQYVAADDEEANAVMVNVGTEPTSERYAPNYNAMNSFAYWITGSDLTDLHLAIVSADKLTAAFAEDLKYNPKYAVPAATLEQIQQPGGFATLATGLNALTQYSVVIWATNGKLDDYFVADYTTDGLPLEPMTTGDYLYAQFWNGTDGGLTLSVDPNYENTYVISNWGGGIDFRFTWDGGENVVVADQFTGYTHASYGDVWVDELADYAGTTDMGVSTYADGVFTFNVIYYVSAGYFGYGEETFTLSDTPAGIAVPKTFSVKAPTYKWNHQIPSFDLPVERTFVQPAKVSVKANESTKADPTAKRRPVCSKADKEIKF